MKSLEEENVRLEKMYADLAIDNQILKDLFTKKCWAPSQKGN
jgi:putative transposase